MNLSISLAAPGDAPQVALFTKALTDEISARTGARHFDVDLEATANLARRLLEHGIYSVLLARDQAGGQAIGFATLCESHALYVGGSFGIVQEFYIAPEYRCRGVGAQLLAAAAGYARQRGWQRLELCTPPLPAFERSLRFYERYGFEVTGGRKMKYALAVPAGREQAG